MSTLSPVQQSTPVTNTPDLHLPDATTLLDVFPGAFIIIDAAGNVIYANTVATQLSGVCLNEVRGQSFATILAERSRSRFVTQYKIFTDPAYPREHALPLDDVRLLRPDRGDLVVDLAFHALVAADGERFALLTLTDHTSLYANEQRIEREPFIDPETGVANRTLWLDRCAQSLERTRRNVLATAVILLNLDRFREVNNSLGYDTGDRVLSAVGKMLSTIVRRTDTVAHLSSDEFAILLDGTLPEHVAAVTSRLLRQVARPIAFPEATVSVTAHAGVAIWDGHGEKSVPDPRMLLHEADAALRLARFQGAERFSIYRTGKDTPQVEPVAKAPSEAPLPFTFPSPRQVAEAAFNAEEYSSEWG